MFITDTLLAERAAQGRPVRVGIAGPGFMATGLINHLVNTVAGIDVAAVYARDGGKARAALQSAGLTADRVRNADSPRAVDRAVASGGVAVTEDHEALTSADSVDVVVDCTGAVEFGAHLALSSIDRGKHLVLLNAEVDATIGALLSERAHRAGVVYTGCDGDQPGVQMNLLRFVRGLGLQPRLAGNIKGLQDPYRTPTTQAGFAEKWGQNPYMVTSFADGTKVSVEQALVANAAGFSVLRRGCLGLDHHDHVDTLTGRYDLDVLRDRGGVVEYVVGARPGPGVFVLAEHPDPKQRHYLNLYKLGEGPLYCFYTPYHLCHFEVPTTIARAALLGDATIRPSGAPRVEVVTVAKRDLRAGEVLDGLGGYTYYGECENAEVQARSRLLPVGLAQGCTVLRDIGRDDVVGYDDVQLPAGRLSDLLRAEQDSRFGMVSL